MVSTLNKLDTTIADWQKIGSPCNHVYFEAQLNTSCQVHALINLVAFPATSPDALKVNMQGKLHTAITRNDAQATKHWICCQTERIQR
eukprot:scaffold87817_cov18-Tisochrysis_lutea.AAC.1